MDFPTRLKELRKGKKLNQVEAGQIAANFLSAPVIKCKKTPRKRCSFVAEVKGKDRLPTGRKLSRKGVGK